MDYLKDFGATWLALFVVGLFLLLAGSLLVILWQWNVTRIFVIIFAVSGILAGIVTLIEYISAVKEDKESINEVD